ncbi:MAG: uroporphyrinogen decarboxylase [Betaproteobacteria bacterium]|nr:uroporphyrinogen decarboxylase [Betaproteobacteria bacterium]
MPALHNDTFLRALARQPTPYTPVWLMRQAGRYLPEYTATRQRAGSFLALAHSPDLATEVTLQPLQRYALDAAILFSDILTVPDAMGLGLYFADGEGPRFRHPLRDEAAIAALVVPDMSKLRYVFDAVAQIRGALGGSVPLIGFSGSPFTLACYMIEGQGSDSFATAKKLLYSRPDLMHHLLDVTASAVTSYLNEQIRAGAQAVMVFDTWGGLLSDAAYKTFSLAYMARIMSGLIRECDGRTVPRIVFTKGGGQWLESIAGCGCDAVGLDWTTDIGAARERVGHQVALQGNFDPAILMSTPAAIAAEAARIIAAYGPHPGHVFNLGHGIWQQTPPEHVRILVDKVRECSSSSRS